EDAAGARDRGRARHKEALDGSAILARTTHRRGSSMKPAAAALVFAIGLAGPARAAAPVDITYGYHPYWTGAWYGVILKKKELWKKYLPAGSKVKFEPHLTGPPMINAMLADKMHIGTMGDMPSLVLTTKGKIADLRLVSVTMFSIGRHCERLMVSKSAPDFTDYNQVAQWLNGKPFVYHRGTCPNH